MPFLPTFPVVKTKNCRNEKCQDAPRTRKRARPGEVLRAPRDGEPRALRPEALGSSEIRARVFRDKSLRLPGREARDEVTLHVMKQRIAWGKETNENNYNNFRREDISLLPLARLLFLLFLFVSQ